MLGRFRPYAVLVIAVVVLLSADVGGVDLDADHPMMDMPVGVGTCSSRSTVPAVCRASPMVPYSLSRGKRVRADARKGQPLDRAGPFSFLFSEPGSL